jgi:hypothetical protein
VECPSLSPLQSRLSILWLPSLWPLNDDLQGRCFVNDKDMPKHNMREVKGSDPSAMSTMRLAYSVSCKGWKSASIIKEILWTNNVNCVKDVPMIYVNFIKIQLFFLEKKRGNYFYTIPPFIVTHHLWFFLQIPIQIREQTVNIHFIQILITALCTSLVWMPLSVPCSQKRITVQ